ncbi:MAG: APC family permease [Cyanobacteria bacterium J06638_7]
MRCPPPPLPPSPLNRLLGPPLVRRAAAHERLSNAQALAVLSSDALSSVAYATQEILTTLVVAGAAALGLALPITLAIVALILVVVLSYRQTIRAYPQGGGSYTVAKENLGRCASLVAAAALLIDYALTAAVSLMAGTDALVSYVPALHPWRVGIALVLLVGVGWANLRGLRESGKWFAIPTMAFVLMVAVLGLAGLLDGGLHHGWRPEPPRPITALEPLGLFLILRAFAAGCSAMTGIEAIANGVQVFRAPEARNARLTLLVMGGLLAAMFLTISSLAWVYGVSPEPRRTTLALLGLRLFGGSSPLFGLLQLSTLLVLVLAANTAFADFPRLGALLAADRFLPQQLAWRGDRLVFQNGILVLQLLAALIVVFCRGSTSLAIHLYAVGVFLAFSLSQSGMVVHWWKVREPGWRPRALMNAAGALATALVLLVILISKFGEGAWIVVLLVPLLVALLAAIRSRYRQVEQELALDSGPRPPAGLIEPLARRSGPQEAAIVHIGHLHLAGHGLAAPGLEAIRYAARIATRVEAVRVLAAGEDPEPLLADWARWVGDGIPLVLLSTPYASSIQPFVDHVAAMERQHPERAYTIVTADAIPRRWFDNLLFNKGLMELRRQLTRQHSRVFTLVRYYLPA